MVYIFISSATRVSLWVNFSYLDSILLRSFGRNAGANNSPIHKTTITMTPHQNTNRVIFDPIESSFIYTHITTFLYFCQGKNGIGGIFIIDTI